jgi:hypothetical protein
MKLKTALLTLVLVISSSSLSAAEGYEKPGDPALTFVPETLSWSEQAFTAADSLETYLESKLLKEIQIQRAKGATTLVKVYSKISPSFKNRDWRIYLKDVRQYKILGYNSKNKLVRTSKLFPAQSNMMAAAMVYLEQDKCSLKEYNLLKPDTWWQTKCSIFIPPKDKLLRAALRSWIHMTDNPASFAKPAENSVFDCLALNAKYSVSGTKLTCQALRDKYGLPETVALYYWELLGGYQITIDTSKNTYKVLYLKPDFQALADLAAWDETSHWITFSGISD